MNTLPTEIIVLGLGTVFLVVNIIWQAMLGGRTLGFDYMGGPRDQTKELADPLAGRVARASRNLQETFPAFAAIAVALVVTQHTGGLGAWGAILWLAARLIYLPLYAAGIPNIRGLAWFASIFGIAFMIIRLFFG